MLIGIFLIMQTYRCLIRQQSIVIFLTKEQSNIPHQKISIIASSTIGVDRNILKAIGYSYLNIKCPMILNVFGKTDNVCCKSNKTTRPTEKLFTL